MTTLEQQFRQVEIEQKKKLLKSIRETIHLLSCTDYDLYLKNQLEVAEIKLTKECIKNECVG